MNFISWTDGPITQLELKYCERCGGLWLRCQGDNEVYCAGCRARMADVPRKGERHSNPRLPRPEHEDIQCHARLKSLEGIVRSEVRL